MNILSPYHFSFKYAISLWSILKYNEWFFLPSESNGKFGATEKAFIFSLRNAEGLPPFKSNVKDPSKAIHNVGHVGPTFGEDDLLIDRISANSSSNFGDNYIVPTGVQNRLTLLAGASTFEEDEVEVFFLLWTVKHKSTLVIGILVTRASYWLKALGNSM